MSLAPILDNKDVLDPDGDIAPRRMHAWELRQSMVVGATDVFLIFYKAFIRLGD
jgi:hypothetical protein